MRIHFADRNDNESVREIDADKYRTLLQTYKGDDLASAVIVESELVEPDPRISELDACEVYFSEVDVRSGITTAEELLEELED